MSGIAANKIVVPFDFSDLSLQAVERARTIADEEGQIAVLHVLEVLPAMEYGNLYGTMSDESRIARVKETLAERFEGMQDRRISLHAVVGDPGKQIAEFAESEKADLIVVPSHGYGFVKHLMLGSVAERVVRLAHCPVLVLRS